MTEFKRGIAFIHIGLVSMTFVLRQGVVKTLSETRKLLTWPLALSSTPQTQRGYISSALEPL